MAKFTPGAAVSEIRGKIAASVFTKNAAGAAIRNRVTPINARTTKQTQARQRLSALSASWRGLTQAQRDGWNSASPNFPQQDNLGQTITLTGAQLYIRSNANLLLVGAAQIVAAPIPASFPVIALGAATMAGGVLTIAFTPTPVPTGFSLAVFATPAGSQGKSFIQESAFRFIGFVAAAGTSPSVQTTNYAAAFGSAPAAGTKLFVKLFLIQTTSGLAGQVVRGAIIAS